MDWIFVNLLVIFCGIALLIGLPFYFKRKNLMEAAQRDFEDYLKNMVLLDKHYAPHIRQLTKNLNTINFWLKTGKDPSENEEDSETMAKEDRFFAGLMDPIEAKRWRAAVKKAKTEDVEDLEVKSIRVSDFEVSDMDPSDVEQTEMNFTYSTDFGEAITYCVTPGALSKHMYRNVVYFTTARPSNIPLVYPHKY
ncbi:MAG: hypothetical protein K6F66_00605, partial [Pseudobutyrivibrio sp.]|nr:hypothetical protein [Pseudobutyrivibrio sp.]